MQAAPSNSISDEVTTSVLVSGRTRTDVITRTDMAVASRTPRRVLLVRYTPCILDNVVITHHEKI